LDGDWFTAREVAAVPIDFGQGKDFLANHVNGGVPMVFNDLDWHGHAHSGIG
jgi:hypothetical protein